MARRPAPRLVLATLVAGALAAAPIPALASVGEPASDAPAEADAALDVAMAAFDIGLEAYKKADYARAVSSWTSAHRLLVHAVHDVEMQRVLGFDLAQAHLRLHATDHDEVHLARARPLLVDYIAWIERPGHAVTRDERIDLEHARELLAILEIDEAAAIGHRRASPYPPGGASELSPELSLEIHRAPSPSPPPPPPEPLRRLRRDANIWLITGGASLGLAVVFGATIGVLARDGGGEVSQPGVGAATAGTVMFAGLGIAALTIGFVKRERVLRATPTLSRTGIGAMVRFAF